LTRRRTALNVKTVTKLSNRGIELRITFGESEPEKPLVPDPEAEQKRPRGHYVYAHTDSSGKVFYVGKGKERRAWSTERHPLWYRYTENHLGGQFNVLILHDNLSPEEADDLEASWIAQCSPDLVNWDNMGREMDYKAIERFHQLRNANRALIQNTKAIDKTDPEKAISEYVRAVDAIGEYASIVMEGGLVGQLLQEEDETYGRSGDIEALDRLTLCLTRLGRAEEAAAVAERYFALYRLDLQLRAADRIRKRVDKALARS